MERMENKGGEFLKISVCEKSMVKFVMVPIGRRKEGWEALSNVLADLLGRFYKKDARGRGKKNPTKNRGAEKNHGRHGGG